MIVNLDNGDDGNYYSNVDRAIQRRPQARYFRHRIHLHGLWCAGPKNRPAENRCGLSQLLRGWHVF